MTPQIAVDAFPPRTKRTTNWNMRRIIVDNDRPCPHCHSTAYLIDPDLGITCTQCAKPPNHVPRKEPPFR